MRKQDWTTRPLSFDQLLDEVNEGWSWGGVEIARKKGRWRAYWQYVDVRGDQGMTMDQPWFDADALQTALNALVGWFRGKQVRHKAVGNGVPGRWVDVPSDLEAPVL